MKRISRMLAVFALCLAMVALPVQAMAESMSMLALTISDPVVLGNGQPILDMTGLSADLTCGMTEDMSKSALQLQVRGGNETALAAVAEIADGKLVLTADGLNEKYSFDMENATQMVGTDAPDMAAIQELAEAVQQLFAGSLMNDIAVPFQDFSNDIMANMQDAGTVNYKMLSGEMEMQHLKLQVTPEAADKLVTGVAAVLDGNPEFQTLLGKLAEIGGEAELANTSLQDLIAQVGLSQQVDMDLYSSADGASMAIEAVQTASTAAEDTTIEVHYRVLMEQAATGLNLYADFDIYEEGAASEGAYLAFQQADEETFSLELGTGEYEGETFTNQFTLKVNVAPTMIGTVAATETKVEVESEGQTMTFTCSGYEDQGKVYGQFAAEVEGMVINAVFDGESTDAGLNGTVDLSAQMPDGTTYGLQAKVNMGPVFADSADVFVGADGAIAIEELGDEDMQSVMNSASALAINAVSVLSRNVPGLSGLLSGMIGTMGN